MNLQRPIIHIVDDDESVRKSLGRLLKSRGLQSREFASGFDLLGYSRRSEASCLLIDVHMPKMSGYELGRNLQESGFGQPIIYITAHLEEESRWQQEPSAAVALLVKPFSEEDLFAAVELALASDLET